jgi:hypothetical protein
LNRAGTCRPARLAGLAGVAVALAALAAGCSEYEDRMRGEQERVDRFDEEMRLLGDPIVLPPLPEKKEGEKKEGEKEIFRTDLFLRPPKGVPSNTESPATATVYQYRRATGLSGNETDGVWWVDVALGDAKDKEFATAVVKEVAPYLGNYQQATEARTPPGREPINFTVSKNVSNRYWLYLCRREGAMVAVGFRLFPSRGNNQPITGEPSAGVRRQIELSLETLAVGKETRPLRESWSPIHRKGGK